MRIVYPSRVIGPDDPKLTPPHRLILQAVKKGQRSSFGGGVSVAPVEEVARAHVAARGKRSREDFSWYDSSLATAEPGYTIRPIGETLSTA